MGSDNDSGSGGSTTATSKDDMANKNNNNGSSWSSSPTSPKDVEKNNDGNIQGEYTMSFRIYGCEFDRSKHVQGTEIKAITYSNMQLLEEIDKVDLYVIVDIWV